MIEWDGWISRATPLSGVNSGAPRALFPGGPGSLKGPNALLAALAVSLPSTKFDTGAGGEAHRLIDNHFGAYWDKPLGAPLARPHDLEQGHGLPQIDGNQGSRILEGCLDLLVTVTTLRLVIDLDAVLDVEMHLCLHVDRERARLVHHGEVLHRMKAHV